MPGDAGKGGGKGGARPGGASGDGGGGDAPDLATMADEFARQFQELGKQLKEGFEKVSDEAQYAIDKELARLIAKHPELYAEIRRTMRQAQRTLDKAAEALGLDQLGKK